MYIRVILILISIFINSYSKDNIPIVIEAEKFEYDNKNKVAIYEDNVVAKKGDFILHSNIMHIFFQPDSKIKKIVAEGNVRFKRGEYSGSSEKAIYIAGKEIIKLLGNAKLKKGNNILEGDEIDYYMNEDKTIVLGKNRKVRTIIIPNELNKGK